MSEIERNACEGTVNLNTSHEEDILKAVKKFSRIAAENRISGMALEEINEEIGKVRCFI